MLTSLDSVDDKITGFDCGADDYLIKPFIFRELLARVKALNRRNRKVIEKSVLRALDLEMNIIERKVTRNGKILNLTSTEFKILELLLGFKGKVFDRLAIAEKIWGFSFNSGTNVVDVHISSLRKKIDKEFSEKLIHTRKGFGYFVSEEQ